MSEFPNPDLAGARALSGQTASYSLAWDLCPWWRAALFLIPILAGAVGLSVAAIRAARSAQMVDSVSIPALQQALRRDPNNPDLLHRLGLVFTYDQANLDFSDSLKYLRQAVALNPNRWEFWSDLGTSCDYVGDTPCSDHAFKRAWALNPVTSTVGWALGNHYLLTDRPELAFPFFRRLLALNPDYLDPTFRICLRATHDPQLIYSQVLPHGKEGLDRFAFLKFLLTTGDYATAMKIWEEMIAGPDRSPNILLVKPFLDFLTDHDRLEDAGTVWGDLQRAGAIPPAPAPQAANLLYNPSFEAPPLDTGFDWRVSSSPELVFDFSDTFGCKTDKCARIDFSVGRNEDYDLLSQIVMVKPNTAYDLSAYVRSDGLTSNAGPQLRVLEVGCKSCSPATSDGTQGTTTWHPIEVSFLTQPGTQAVRVSFWRPHSAEALGDISGTVWLDDVNLHPTPPAAGQNVARAR